MTREEQKINRELKKRLPQEIRKLNKKYGAFMKGANGKDLESAVLTRFSEMVIPAKE